MFNVGSGKLKTINEIAELVQPDEKKRTHVAKRKNDLIGTLASTCEAKKQLGFMWQIRHRRLGTFAESVKQFFIMRTKAYQ